MEGEGEMAWHINRTAWMLMWNNWTVWMPTLKIMTTWMMTQNITTAWVLTLKIMIAWIINSAWVNQDLKRDSIINSCFIPTTAIFLWSSSNPVSSWVRKHRWSYTETPTQVLTWAPGFSIPCIDFVLSDKISRQMGVRLEIRGEVYDTSPHLDTELQVSLYQGGEKVICPY